MNTITEKAMLVALNISQFNPHKPDKKVTDEVLLKHMVSGDSGRFVKNLLPKDSMASITKVVSEARVTHYKNTLPWDDDGARILPSANYMSYAEKMRGLKGLFETAVCEFVGRYDDLVQKARVTLNGMFNESDYPSLDLIRDKFGFNIRVLPIPTGSDFRIDIDEQERQELGRKLEERVAEAQSSAIKDLYARMAAPIKHMLDTLTDENAQFRNSLVSNVKEIIELAPSLNLTGDPVLADICRQAEQLANVNPDKLRSNNFARKATAAKADEIYRKLAQYNSQA